MARVWDEGQLLADGFERVYIELDWNDGARAGLADVDGVAHYFQGHDYALSSEADEYAVWPASAEVLGLEREQWAIFVEWSRRYEAGVAESDSHPGHGGIDAGHGVGWA